MAGKTETADHGPGADHHDDPKANLETLQIAQTAAAEEHSVGLKQALRENWQAAMWSAIISLTIVMEGYDLSLMANFFGYPTFQRKFGHYYAPTDSYELTGPWQAGLLNGTNCGVIIGGFINGYVSSRYGYRRVIQIALLALTGFIFVSFFAVRIEMLLVGQMLCGLTFGVFATSCPAYASEICPLALRGYMTVYINLCWAMGQFLANGVLRGMLEHEGDLSWRVPIAVQWAWPLPICIAIFFAPESPWWLVKKGRFDEALDTLGKLSTRTREQCEGTLAQMRHTIELEDDIQGEAGYLDCFKGTNRRRTEICMVVFAGQQLAGTSMAYTPTYFFRQAGISAENAFTIAIGSTGMAFLGTCFSWVLLTHFGRRTLYTVGMTLAAVSLLLVGICAAASSSSASQWSQVSLILVWKLFYSMTVGPICYAIISETSAIRLRPQTVVIARNTYVITQITCGILNPYMLNPSEWAWRGKAGFFWAGTGGLIALWAYFRLPETRDRTYADLDLLFERKISARKFRETEVNPHTTHEEVKGV